MGERRGVSKGVEDGRSPATGRRREGHGGPKQYFKETVATPCYTPMGWREALGKTTTIWPKNLRVGSLPKRKF
jgi:hypothetical protein